MATTAFDIEMTIPGVLKAAKWASAAELAGAPAALRAALVRKLVEHSNQAREFFENLPDDQLVGCGAIDALMLASGVRDQAWMKTETLDNHRNTLIVETVKRTGRTGEDWGPDNRRLARVGLQWFVGSGAGLSAPTFRDAASAGDTDRTALAYFQMLFERARSHYLASRFDETAGLLNWLVKVVPFALDSSNTSEEYQLVVQPLIESFLALEDNAAAGRDYSGLTMDFVPALAITHYVEQLDRNLKSFETLEKDYASFQDHTRTLAERQSDYAEAIGQKAVLAAELKYERDLIRGELRRIVDEIEAAGRELPSAKRKLLDEIGGLKEQIYKTFNVPDPEKLSNILVNLAFMPEAAPQKAAMGASQVLAGASAFMKSATSLRLEDGTEVSQSLVIKRVATIGSDVTDLGAAYTVMSQKFIQPSDGVYRLYQRARDFEALCEQLYSIAPRSVEVKEAMEEFVRKVTARNSKIDQYNALWARAGDIDGQMRKIAGDKRAEQQIVARNEAPGAHFQAAALNNLHGRARDVCLRDLALMGRAYAFWALRPYDQLEEICKLSDPDAISHSTLDSAKNKIQDDLSRYVQDILGKLRQGSIPDEGTELKIAKGIELDLTPQSDKKFIDDLRTKGEASFELLPSHPKFANLANVRVKRVRAWVHGLEPKPALNIVEISHDDQETVVGVDRVRHQFRHDPVTAPMFRYDPTKGVGNPKAIFEGQGGTSDGHLDEKTFAPIGPFTKWTIRIPDSDVEGFSRDSINKVVMEFHVMAQNFDARPRS
jgi:hypothetical protein